MEKPHNVAALSVDPVTPRFVRADRIVHSKSKNRREAFGSNFYARMRLASSFWKYIYSTGNDKFTVSDGELAQSTSSRRVVKRWFFDDGFVSPSRGSWQSLVCPEDGGRERHQEAKTDNVSICRWFVKMRDGGCARGRCLNIPSGNDGQSESSTYGTDHRVVSR